MCLCECVGICVHTKAERKHENIEKQQNQKITTTTTLVSPTTKIKRKSKQNQRTKTKKITTKTLVSPKTTTTKRKGEKEKK